ncbi:Receptor-like protein kinase 1 [Melia azedarach]|uniref:Receptor-like protein kinase 1 n=1 Tax=Melia azedarach TaxID=155640 RepID=A0ACC1XVV9_MELAZ|nr:Receptor-like protein kinase 1 [Melia azedarach]
MAKNLCPLFMILFVLLLSESEAQSSRTNNITTGSTLYANSTPNFWSSPSGHFAFGFYPSGDGFRIGIWLVGIPKNTVVWTATRDAVISAGAALSFPTDEGRIVLHSFSGEILWSTGKDLGKAVLASMLDSGNFVLYNSSFTIVWASFDCPTDTILVGQKLARSTALYSSVSASNQSVGNFKLWMQFDGNLDAFPVRSVMETKYVYWTADTCRPGENLALNLDQDGHLFVGNSNGSIVRNLTDGALPVNSTTLYRASLDVDGIFRLYQHQIGTKGSLNSKIMWAAVNEEDRCSVKGTCGLNSYCSLNGSGIACLCPPGFVYADPTRPQDGCKLISDAENACLENESTKDFTVVTLENTYWERNDYDVITPASEEDCSDACLEDCNCVVAQFGDQTCFKLMLPLRYGRNDTTNPNKALIKVRTHCSPPVREDRIINNMSKIGKEFLIVGVVLIAFSLIVFMFTGYLVYAHQISSYKIVSRQASNSQDVGEINLRSFSYRQLVTATDNFKEEIGRGGSGRVYKGSLAVNNNGGKEIAVKKLIKMVEDGENEFRNEMRIIGRTHHKNLVNLVGFCSEGANRLLVYEFMKNGSLENLLFKANKRPSWNERRRIALEIAKGIHYLHEECQTRIIHCDIKPHNILMDECWTAKISDFGLSKLLKPDQTRTYTVARGTRGYAAPEWHGNNLPITVKADVYSYGVMLLEIICCRKKMDACLRDEEIILMDWVYQCYEADEFEKLVHVEDDVEMKEFETMVKIGLLCVENELTLRPTMKEVISMMEGILVTPPPRSPYSSVKR